MPDADFFAALSEPRRPWIHADALKAKFLELGSQHHPDRFHSSGSEVRAAAEARFTLINSAYQALKEPRDRLSHLLELETGARPKDIQRIPSGSMDLFVEIGQACRGADEWISGRSKEASPLIRVQRMRDAREWMMKLGALQQTVNQRTEAAAAVMQELNSAWEAADPLDPEARKKALPLDKLEEIYRGASYAARWTAQIQQRMAELAVP